MLDLRRLRLLRELDARGTVGAVARALDYTPSAVSQQLAVLEQEAGVPLLERVGRNVRLTDAGRVLVQHAASLLDGVEAAEADLAAAGGVVAGTVRVASFQSAMLELITPAIAALQRTAPAVRVEVVEWELEESLPALRTQQVDLVLAEEYGDIARPRPPDVDREDLLHEGLHVVLPARHPQARAERVPMAALREDSWATGAPGSGQWQMTVGVCRRFGGFEPDLRHQSNDLLILLELVRTTGAVSFMPDLVLTKRAGRGLAIKDIAEAELGRTVFSLARRGSARRPALTAFQEALRAQVATVG